MDDSSDSPSKDGDDSPTHGQPAEEDQPTMADHEQDTDGLGTEEEQEQPTDYGRGRNADSGGTDEPEGDEPEATDETEGSEPEATDETEGSEPEATDETAGSDAEMTGRAKARQERSTQLQDKTGDRSDSESETPNSQNDMTSSQTGSGMTADAESTPESAGQEIDESAVPDSQDGAGTDPDTTERNIPEDVQKYDRFKKVDGAQYERVNDFLRDRTYITAREWAIARLCADFRTETGVEMTKIGENLPELVPFMTDTYTAQAVNQARASFEEKVRKSGATFLYGAMSDFFTADELDDVMYEVTEVAKFLLEVEGVELVVDEELEAEDRISEVMREVRESSQELRHEECPECGHDLSEE